MAYNYPYGNGQQLNLDWFLNEWKNLLAAWDAEKNGIEGALQAEIDRAEAALADVFAARDAAAQSAANALESKNAAAQSASDASGYLATVRADANTAHNAAQNAAQSEINAAESAQTALASKNTAANSERNAAQSEANALAYKDAAAQSASAAAQSAEDADASKRAAAQSAEDASDAAASVEASAQQITTNARNISNLNEFGSQYSFIENSIRTLSGVIVTQENDGSYHYSGTTTATINSSQGSFHCVAGKTYRFHINTDYNNDETSEAYFYIRNVNNTSTWYVRKDFTFTATINHDVSFMFYANSGISINATIKPYYTTQPTNAELTDKNIIAKTLQTMVAESALVVNNFVIVENSLYRVTAPIASGGTLTIGTNVETTTIADVLKSLLN